MAYIITIAARICASVHVACSNTVIIDVELCENARAIVISADVLRLFGLDLRYFDIMFLEELFAHVYETLVLAVAANDGGDLCGRVGGMLDKQLLDLVHLLLVVGLTRTETDKHLLAFFFVFEVLHARLGLLHLLGIDLGEASQTRDGDLGLLGYLFEVRVGVLGEQLFDLESFRLDDFGWLAASVRLVLNGALLAELAHYASNGFHRRYDEVGVGIFAFHFAHGSLHVLAVAVLSVQEDYVRFRLGRIFNLRKKNILF